MLGKYPTPLEDFGGLPVHFTTSSLVTPPPSLPNLLLFPPGGRISGVISPSISGKWGKLVIIMR